MYDTLGTLRPATVCLALGLMALLAGCVSPPQAVDDERDLPEEAALAVGDPAGQDPQEREPWEPPEPDPTDFDWIKLTNGEWLKGDIKFLREDSLEFDSDEMGVLTFDWGDIEELRSPRENAVVLEQDLETVIGTILVRDGEIVMSTAAGERRFARDELLSMVPGPSSGLGYWSGKVSFGANIQSGNTDQTTINTLVSLKRASPVSRVSLDYIGNFGETDGTTNIDNSRFTGRWDLFTSKDWFVTPFGLDLYRDKFQNIKLQANPAAGLGYHAIDQPTTKLDLSLLGGYRHTEFDSVAAGEDEDDGTVTTTPAIRLDWDITNKIELNLRYELNIAVPDTNDTNQHFIASLSIDIWGDADLDLTFQWDRIGDPAADSSGEPPDNDDFRMGVGLGWSF